MSSRCSSFCETWDCLLHGNGFCMSSASYTSKSSASYQVNQSAFAETCHNISNEEDEKSVR